MSFNDFVQNCNLKNKATSNLKIQQVLGCIGLNNVGIPLGDGLLKTDVGIVSSHPNHGTHWVLYINEK